MAFLAEQHLVAAKLVRGNGATRTGAERVTPDWSVIDEQVGRLSPPQIDGPPLIPNL